MNTLHIANIANQDLKNIYVAPNRKVDTFKTIKNFMDLGIAGKVQYKDKKDKSKGFIRKETPVISSPQTNSSKAELTKQR